MRGNLDRDVCRIIDGSFSSSSFALFVFFWIGSMDGIMDGYGWDGMNWHEKIRNGR